MSSPQVNTTKRAHQHTPTTPPTQRERETRRSPHANTAINTYLQGAFARLQQTEVMKLEFLKHHHLTEVRGIY
ncbi:hypothetical protein LRQ08_31705 (plasmid) [Rhodococcus qingshengii]|uniref:hypothetical protein n=1 Tax=Rhodococcus qingshengii TaxID=334542 RepID=UPI0021131426|nr:hypothetical protein [Rhodococcus qingshengii]UUE28500.1 hypothetical protein LRQ08_31705 [Rhodococcus qingshengii]